MLIAEQNQSILPLVGVVVAMLLLLLTFWRISRRTTNPLEPWPRGGFSGRSSPGRGATEVPAGSSAGRTSPADTPAHLAAWEVQMHETAREVSAVVDTKLRLLQQLVAEADRAATRLERAVQAAQKILPPQDVPRPSEDASRLPETPESSDPSSLPPGGPSQTEFPQPPLRPESTFRPSTENTTAQQNVAATSPIRPETIPLEVGLLADYGFPVEEIASRCGIPVSEVKRILQARNQHTREQKQ